MPKKPSSLTEDFRSVITQAIKAYELVQTANKQAERQAQDELQQRLKTLKAQQQNKRQQMEDSHKQKIAEATAKQNRIKDLIMALDQVKQASHTLLEKASLSYILNEPIHQEGAPPNDSKDKTLATDFADGQMAFTDLQTALLRLATAYVNAARWDDARQVVQPLLDDTQSTLYKQACNLYCKTYYDPAITSIEAGEFESARQGFEAVLAVRPSYKDSQHLLCETYYQPAVAALNRRDWEGARQGFETVLARFPDYQNSEELLCEAYYQLAVAAYRAEEFESARQNFEAILNRNKTYRDTLFLIRQMYFSLSQSAIEAGRLDEAQRYLKTWLEEHKDDNEFRDLLCESYYKPAFTAIQTERWLDACEGFESVLQINATYLDASVLLREASLRPAKKALNENDFNEADRYLSAWLLINKNDAEMLDLRCEVYYRSALLAMQAQNWQQVLADLNVLRSLNPHYKDIASWSERYLMFTWIAGTINVIQLFTWPANDPIFAFSPQRKLVVAAGQNQIMKIWEADSGSEKGAGNTGLTGPINALTFSPDGKLLVSANYDKTVRVGEVDTGKLLHQLKGHQEPVDKLVFSPDGQFLISWTSSARSAWVSDKALRVWDIKNGQLLHTLSGLKKYVYDVIFSPGGRFLATLSGDNTLKVWEMQTGHLLQTFNGITDPNGIISLSKTSSIGQLAAFSPDERLIAMVCTQQTNKGVNQFVFTWDLNSGKSLYSLNTLTNQGMLTGVTFSPDGYLLTADYQNLYNNVNGWGHNEIQVRVIAWEMDMGRDVFQLYQKNNTSPVLSMAFSSDKRFVILARATVTEIWDYSQRKLLHTLQTGFTNNIVFSSDEKILVSIDNTSSKSVIVWGPKI